MVYFQLGLLALVFSLFGYYLHAFFLGTSQGTRESTEAEALGKELEEKRQEVREARDEVARTSTIVRSLEEQIRQRDAGMESLQRMAARQDEQIGFLEREAAAIRAAVGISGLESHGGAREPEKSLLPSNGEKVLAPVTNSSQENANLETEPVGAMPKAPKIPGWQENLDTILNILDTMEKEIEK